MLRVGSRRTAICFSGQLRTWRKCVDTWKNVLEENGSRDNIDVFCHLWDFNSEPNAVNIGKPSISVPVSQEEIDEVLKILQPKKVLVESEKVFAPTTPNQAITTPSFISQFYGVMRASRLKKEYEIENDIMYDAVVRARYDAFYLSNVSEHYKMVRSNTMHGFHLGWEHTTNKGRMGDICWVADSQTYNIIADYYLNLGTIDAKWFSNDTNFISPEWVFFHYLKKNAIALENNRWDIKLYRESEELSVTKKKDGYELW